ncbi:hypothetical protein QAD02_010540 [Eretmocerus hayati]|uniref:Uncharacterized protein n=1 Tax=Eretmocerus hayati TaxID=131215 RepID=A0ACC2NU72_9HYME|nr:hypothetical protein QAD02_010540 [Eretmocerus hayati]
MKKDEKIIFEMLDSKMWKSLTKEHLMRVSKSSTASDALRKAGNDMFKNIPHNAHSHEQVWKMYSMSIAVAEKNTEGLALAYENRSAMLFHLGKFEACIKDIDRALEISQNIPFKIELLCRKIRCMHTLNAPNIHEVVNIAEALLDGLSKQSVKTLHSDSLKKIKLKLKQPNHLKGFMENEKIKVQGFRSVYSLADQVSEGSLEKRLQDTALVLRSIARNTALFGEDFNHSSTEAFQKNDNVLFIGALILKLSKVSQLNQHQMWNGNYVCQNKLDRLSCWLNECCSRGTYIAPVTSLLNHSCDPNVRRCFTEDKKVILYAIHPIKKGSQLFDCYQQEYYELDLIPRQRILSETYNFECKCIACLKKWPHLTRLFQNDQGKPLSARSVVEVNLMMEYNALVSSTLKPDKVYRETDVAFLGEGIQKGLAKLSKPSFITVNLIICLNTVFERLCGIWLTVPNTCQKS